MSKTLAESALIAPIPEAEFLVSRFRAQYDPSAALGVPAHVTLLYPFKPPSKLDRDVIERLGKLFAAVKRFEVSFTRTKRFPGVLYLVPEPDGVFRRLTETIVKQFPETPPYGGKFAEIIPHLTIAQVTDSQHLDAIAVDFEIEANGRLPITAAVTELCLIDNQSGRWTASQRFPLGHFSVSL